MGRMFSACGLGIIAGITALSRIHALAGSTYLRPAQWWPGLYRSERSNKWPEGIRSLKTQTWPLFYFHPGQVGSWEHPHES